MSARTKCTAVGGSRGCLPLSRIISYRNADHQTTSRRHVVKCYALLKLPPAFPGLNGYTSSTYAMMLEVMEVGRQKDSIPDEQHVPHAMQCNAMQCNAAPTYTFTGLPAAEPVPYLPAVEAAGQP